MARTQPISDRIVVKVDERSNTSSGGIIMLDPAKHEHPAKTGVVLAVGPGKPSAQLAERDQMQVAVGDKISFVGFAGKECPWDEEENVIIITQDDVHYVIS